MPGTIGGSGIEACRSLLSLSLVVSSSNCFDESGGLIRDPSLPPFHAVWLSVALFTLFDDPHARAWGLFHLRAKRIPETT
jgi:hypothetical protein